jgi:flavin-dependent dehydrogenase
VADDTQTEGEVEYREGDREVGYAPRRRVLDTILADAAKAGAEVRTEFSVDEIVTDGDRVSGIRGRAANGHSVVEEAPITIGADGRHSLVARTVKPAS